MEPALEIALRLVAANGSQISDDWWIIGSTAALLAGCDAFEPDDIDLFGSTQAMSAFVKSFGKPAFSGPLHTQFRSMPYQRVIEPAAKPIEVMGGLEVFHGGKWRKLQIKSRVPVAGFGAPLWIPAVEEQIAIFQLFGRPKDLAKATALRDICN
jgi:hypothetical protein